MPDHRRSARREMDESHAHLARLPVGAACRGESAPTGPLVRKALTSPC